MRADIAVLATVAALAVLIVPTVVADAYGGPQIAASHVEGRTFMFSLDAAGDVTWDFGDGVVVISGEPVAHSFPYSGMWSVSASAGGTASTAQVMVYDQSPELRAIAGREYRWAPPGYVSSAEAVEKVSGSAVDWLSWDSQLRCFRGVPDGSHVGETILVRALIGGIGTAYDLTVSAGAGAVSAEFSIETDGLQVSLTPAYPPDVALWFWTMYDMDGKKVSLSTGAAPVMIAPEAGGYVVRAVVSTLGGSAEYSKVIVLRENDLTEQSPSYAMYAVAVLAILAIILIVRFL